MTRWQQLKAWVKAKATSKSKFWRFAVFLIAPQLVAAIFTGHGIRALWRDIRGQGKGVHSSMRHIVRVAVVWGLAYLWLLFFWGGIIYLVKKLIS